MSKKNSTKYPRKELVLIVNVDRDKNSEWANRIAELFGDIQGHNNIDTGYCCDTGEMEIFIPLGGILNAKICEN